MLSCENCKKSKFMTVMSVAKCGHPTGRGGMELCPDCAKRKNACEACATPLDGDDKNDDPPPHTD